MPGSIENDVGAEAGIAASYTLVAMMAAAADSVASPIPYKAAASMRGPSAAIDPPWSGRITLFAGSTLTVKGGNSAGASIVMSAAYGRAKNTRPRVHAPTASAMNSGDSLYDRVTIGFPSVP